jgi:DNA polymerase III subunit delta'
VHLILLTDRLVEVLPTIRSRCQLVRFDAPAAEEVAALLEPLGVEPPTALACARLSLDDAERARELAGEGGQTLRAAAERFARAAVQGQVAGVRPWAALIDAVRRSGEAIRSDLELRAMADIELYPKRERRRIETEWTDRIRRARRRVETAALDLGLQVVSLWFADLAFMSWGARDLVRHVDRLEELRADATGGPGAEQLRRAVELVEETRMRFQLNVSEELACEALAYRLERALAA